MGAMCKNLFVFLVLLCSLFMPSEAFAEGRTVEADGYYTVGDGAEENFSVARERAKQDAMGRAAEMAAVYVEKFTAVKNHQLTASEVRTLAAKVLSVESTTFENTTEGNVFKIRCHVVAQVKEEEALASLMSDREKLKESLQREQEKDEKIAELNRQMEELQQQYQAAKTDGERTRIQQQAKTNDTQFTAAQWVEKAIRAQDSQDYTKATAFCLTAIELDPQLVSAYKVLGETYFSLDENNKAIESFNKVIELNPDDKEGYWWLGNLYKFNYEYNRAIECLNKAIALDPNYVLAYHSLGTAYGSQNEHDKAIECYKKAIDLGDDSAYSYNLLGMAYSMKDEYDKAIECYNKVLALDSSYESIISRSLGNAYAGKGEYDKAIEYYSKAIALHPKDSWTYHSRGFAYEKLGCRKEAKQDYAKAHEINPRDETIRKDKERSKKW